MRQVIGMGIAVLLAASTAWAQARTWEVAKVTPEMKAVTEASNEFAFDLYAKLSGTAEGNIFFSPSSIHTALAMTYAGAAGVTADQMAKTMHYSFPGDKLAVVYGGFIKVLNTPRLMHENKPSYELVVSNALWPAKHYPFKSSFTELVRTEYRAILQELDYLREAEASRKIINDTIARQTKDKIQGLIPPGAITDLTRLILTNAIYFKSSWMYKFPKEATRAAPFTQRGGKTADCPMMHRQGHYGYFEDADLQVLEMPYMYYELSMVVLLPKKTDGLGDLEKKLSAKQFSQWADQAKMREVLVRVSFPRFRFSGQFSLADTLIAMGMRDAFSLQSANFTAITTAERLAISQVIHKSFVAVDEEGTEAAAATAAWIVRGSWPRPQEPKVFNADHPFLFLIRHYASGAILFLGRLTAPEGGGEAPKSGETP